MFNVEIVKHKRHCNCGNEIVAGEMCLVFGKKEERLGRRNLCEPCVLKFAKEVEDYNANYCPYHEDEPR